MACVGYILCSPKVQKIECTNELLIKQSNGVKIRNNDSLHIMC
jgi:hypothetical protein